MNNEYNAKVTASTFLDLFTTSPLPERPDVDRIIFKLDAIDQKSAAYVHVSNLIHSLSEDIANDYAYQFVYDFLCMIVDEIDSINEQPSDALDRLAEDFAADPYIANADLYNFLHAMMPFDFANQILTQDHGDTFTDLALQILYETKSRIARQVIDAIVTFEV